MPRGPAQARDDESSAVKVELDEWPIAVFRMPRIVDVKVAGALGQAIDKLLERKEEFVIVIDSRSTTDTPPDARRAIAAWEKARDAPLRAYAKATAFVMPNRAMFAIVGLISWLNPPPYPKECFLGEGEAKVWVREKLSRRP
ncbi:MAG TPA: hypothetical protein VFS43_06210 [Polyangiaceae bacterium]|nr:hypothetical protein [Polyangiaceae bacterium]